MKSPGGPRAWWPRHARDSWDARVLPVRLAGDMPWPERIHVVVGLSVSAVGVLLAVSGPLAGEDIGDWAPVAVLSLPFVAFGLALILFLRRGRSVLVTAAGVGERQEARGVWFSEVVGASGRAVTATSLAGVRVEPDESDVGLIGGGFDLDVPVRRWAVVLHRDAGSVRFPGLTFAANRGGRGRA